MMNTDKYSWVEYALAQISQILLAPQSDGHTVCFAVFCLAAVGSWTNKVVILRHLQGSVLCIRSVVDELAGLPLACCLTQPPGSQFSYQAACRVIVWMSCLSISFWPGYTV